MKVIRIAVQVSTRYVNSGVEDEINVYVEDDATEKEIEQAKEDAAREWMFEEIEWGYQDIERRNMKIATYITHPQHEGYKLLMQSCPDIITLPRVEE